jgi:Domain of unknown function (DUF1839)
MAARSDSLTLSGFVGSARLAWNGAHEWHTGERIWSQTTPRLDTWISLLHTLDLDPLPILSALLCSDFEGDQWSAPRVPASDVWSAHGLVVEEMCVWRPLLAHLVEQLDRGHAVLVEVDEFHLPDLVGSSYQRAHSKTVIAFTGYDRHAHSARYIHGAFGGEIGGEDLDSMLAAGIGSAQLAPTTTLVRLDRMVHRAPDELARIGVALARFHGTRFPVQNPVRAFGEALRSQGTWLAGGDEVHYARWAFATLHQCGAAFELGSDVCDWLASHGEPTGAAGTHLRAVSRGARALHQRLVRVPQSGRMPDVAQTVEEMARSWDDAMVVLKHTYGA